MSKTLGRRCMNGTQIFCVYWEIGLGLTAKYIKIIERHFTHKYIWLPQLFFFTMHCAKFCNASRIICRVLLFLRCHSPPPPPPGLRHPPLQVTLWPVSMRNVYLWCLVTGRPVGKLLTTGADQWQNWISITPYSANAGIMPGQRRRRCPGVRPALAECAVISELFLQIINLRKASSFMGGLVSSRARRMTSINLMNSWMGSKGSWHNAGTTRFQRGEND